MSPPLGKIGSRFAKAVSRVPFGAALSIAVGGCVTTTPPYAPPASGPTATLELAYIELGAYPGTLLISAYTKPSASAASKPALVATLSPAKSQSPDDVEVQSLITIPASGDFRLSFQLTGSATYGAGNYTCKTGLKFTPEAGGQYRAILFNKTESCFPAVLKRTPTGLVPDPTMSK